MPDTHEQEESEELPEEYSTSEEEHEPATVETLRQKLAQCRKDKNDYLLGWQRCKADAINIKQQHETKQRDIIQFAAEDIIQSLIPVLDTFNHALEGKDSTDPYVQGFGHVKTQLLYILSQQGLSIISDTGTPFDVSRHEAIASVQVSEEKDNNKVLETIEYGYALYGKVIKPAKVKIGEYNEHTT